MDPKQAFLKIEPFLTKNVTKIPFLESLKIMMNNESYFNFQKRKKSRDFHFLVLKIYKKKLGVSREWE